MIHYHGGPITPETAAVRVWTGRHAFVSFAHPLQIRTAASVCQSFALDNGAYSMWRDGRPTNWPAYFAWCEEWLSHPGCDFAVIPDVIDGDEADNDSLLQQWPHKRGVPVWHMHESTARLQRLCDAYERVALGSSGQFATVGSDAWWERMDEAMAAVCVGGRPRAKLHGLRMLNPRVFTRLPLSSADSTNVSRNIGIDKAWKGTYAPATREARGAVIAERIEHHHGAAAWDDSRMRARIFA